MAATSGDGWLRMATSGVEWRRWHKRALTWKVPSGVVSGNVVASCQRVVWLDTR